ncbi:capsid protein VP1 [Trichonephila clavata]|uniref:Capsid protein VP1 n=1 Tax=Trichonephila clavata TaxID=2740835 RepID=A0A8X6JMV9_TRICU|nr:capsid protein VP1 [Trichonephila clavata]
MNEGQKRYSYEQYNLARIRRGLPIDHPIPSLDTGSATEEAAIPTDQVSPLDEIPEDSQAVPSNQEVEMADANVGDKRTADEEGGGVTKRTGSILPGSGENANVAENAAGESSVIPIPRPRDIKYQSIRVFQKVHRLLTYGIAYIVLDYPYAYQAKTPAGAQASFSETNFFLTTPLAMVPWEYDFFYLNPSEWTLLPPGATALKCEVKVRAENIRIAFPTNASSTELATLNQNKFIRVGKGLLQNVPSVNVKYTAFDDNNPMKPTSCEVLLNTHLSHLVGLFYGVEYTPETVEKWKKTIPNHQIGLPVILNNYLAVVNSGPYGEGWPQIQQFVKEYNAEGMKSTPICEMAYEPRMGMLKSGARSIYTGYPNVKPEHTRLMEFSTGALDVRGFTALIQDRTGDITVASSKSVNRDDPDAGMVYGNIIEKSTMHCKGLFDTFQVSTQPTLHLGVQPVPSLSTKNISDGAVDKWTDTQAYFEVEATMVVNCDDMTLRPFATYENVPPHEEIRHFQGSLLNVGRSMYNGLYQKSK